MKTEKPVLIGRHTEKETLDHAYRAETAEFIAVYGRRRIGKTYLIKTFFKQKRGIFFHITGTRDATMTEQLDDFTRIIESTFYEQQLTITNPLNWKKAFDLLTRTIQREALQQPVILFFDELPWLSSKRSRFIQALEYYWNRYWSDLPNIKLIVCGSAASWMLDHVISQKGGLHNRISAQIPLAPFDLAETKAYIASKGMNYHHNQILEIFMVTGGVPYYLNFLKKHLSVPQNIDQLCFQNKGQLVEEFGRLYASLFDNAEAHEELVRLIASKHQGIERTDILKKSKLSTDGGRLKKRLEALEQSGFIVSFKPYGFTRRGTFYRVIDEYTLFYLNWIEPTLSTIKKLDKTTGYWLEKCQSPSWRSWAGYAFESVCYKHIAQIRKTLNISASAAVGSWHYIPKKSLDEGAQIDLLFDRTDGVITICEMKYTMQPFQVTKEEARSLLKKVAVFKTKTKTTKQIHIALITNLPIKETMYSEDIIHHRVTLEDLLKSLS